MRLILPALTVAFAAAVQPAWTPQSSAVTARLRGVSAVSDTVAWASGSAGTVLRTTDAGATWTKLAVPGAEKLDFRDVDAFDEKTAYVLSIGNGELSRIYKTVDGGATWALQLSNTDPAVFLDAMAFWSPDRGIAFSDSSEGRFAIFRTDNGTTWRRIEGGLFPALPNEGAYAASGTNVAVHGVNHVWIGTTASRVLRSADGGRTWKVAQTPIPKGEAIGIFSIAFRDQRHGVAVGGNYQREDEAIDNVAFTADGGATWKLGKRLSGYRSAVAHVPGTTATWIAIGPRGADLSKDDGKTWTKIDATGADSLSFAMGRGIGWSTGARGTISRIETNFR